MQNKLAVMEGDHREFDAIGYHHYGQSGLTGHLNNTARFGFPIWLTEFAYYDAATAEQQQSWMAKCVATR